MIQKQPLNRENHRQCPVESEECSRLVMLLATQLFVLASAGLTIKLLTRPIFILQWEKLWAGHYLAPFTRA